MQRLWATQFFFIGILLCSLASANSADELIRQRDSLDRELKLYEQLLDSGRIIVPSWQAPLKYYTPKEFGVMLPQLMIEHGYNKERVVQFLSGIITFHQTYMQEIKTKKIPRLQKKIRELNNRISAITPGSPNRQPGNSDNQQNFNIYSSNYGKIDNAPDIMTEYDRSFQEPIAQQGGIIARVIRKYECKYGSGGRPSTRSHHFCKVEFSLENTSEKPIAFSTGFTETEHAWDGELNRERVAYTRDLYPGKIMKLRGICIIPHKASHGNWKAWGTGYHRGNSNKKQFSWNIRIGCP